MKRLLALVEVLIFGAVAWTVNAQTIVCDGRVDGGSGIVSCDPSPRDYVYRVAHPSPQAPESVYVGTQDPNPANYTSFCLPPGWTWAILPTSAVPAMSAADYNSFTPHGTVSPGPTGACPYVLFFEGPLPPATPLDFGFDHIGYPHDVSWRMAGFPIGTSNWSQPVGSGAGPVHGPSDCDTTCAIPPNSVRVTNVILAGKKDNFDFTDGVEPAFPSPALLALLNSSCPFGPLKDCNPTLADCEFDCAVYDRCFGHTFAHRWDTCGCVVAAQLCFKIRAISGGSTDVISFREDGVGVWGMLVQDLRNYYVGIPTWNAGDVFEYCVNLAHLPQDARGITNVLGLLLDGDLDVYIADDTEVDYLELTVVTCCDTCCAVGDIDGDGVPLTVGDLTFLSNFVNSGGPPPTPLCWGDLNADGFIDQADIDMLQCFFTFGMSCFPQYPIHAPCLPDTVRGGCCHLKTCNVQSPQNCTASGGSYRGNGDSCTPNPCRCCGVWGDATGDDAINPIDVVCMVNFVYKANDTRVPRPDCPRQIGDVNCDNAVNPVDVVRYVNYVYKSNPAGWCPDPCGP